MFKNKVLSRTPVTTPVLTIDDFITSVECSQKIERTNLNRRNHKLLKWIAKCIKRYSLHTLEMIGTEQ